MLWHAHIIVYKRDYLAACSFPADVPGATGAEAVGKSQTIELQAAAISFLQRGIRTVGLSLHHHDYFERVGRILRGEVVQTKLETFATPESDDDDRKSWGATHCDGHSRLSARQ
jgi:hypothetical protein